MAATVWSPAPYISRQEWLLSDGSIVTSPDFEASSSGRRVRVAGTTTSIGVRQVDTLIQASIDKLAADRNASRVMRIFPDDESDAAACSRVNSETSIFTEAVTLHLLNARHASDNSRGRTTAVWKYQAQDLSPLLAYVFVTLEQRYNESYLVTTHVVWRDTRTAQQATNNMISYEGTYLNGDNIYRYAAEHDQITQAFSLPFKLESRSYNHQMRTAVVKFAEICRQIDQYDEIVLPDTATPSTSRVFKRSASNYSASFNAELMDFVQTGPVLERIQSSYEQLLQDFKTLGIVVTGRINGGDFAQVVGGDLTTIKATVVPNEEEDANGTTIDTNHSVTFDFATGTVVVNCSRANDLDETAQAWEIAKFKAEMTGEVDVLLEYAQAYRNPKEQARLRKILSQRKIDIENP